MSKQWFQKTFSNWQIFHRPLGWTITNSPTDSFNSTLKINKLLFFQIKLFFWLCVQKTLYSRFLAVCALDVFLVFIWYSKKIIKVMCTSKNCFDETAFVCTSEKLFWWKPVFVHYRFNWVHKHLSPYWISLRIICTRIRLPRVSWTRNS